jgi:hypothetical protein
MKTTFLGASQPLTKTFSLDSAGQLVKGSYPLVNEFTSYEEDVATLKDFAEAIERHAAEGHCLLKGNTNKQLNSESRAGSTNSDEVTSWICLDFDGAADIRDLEEFFDSVDVLNNVDYVLQYSASHGIDKRKKLSAHVFMLLGKPQMPSYIKSWLRSLNLNLPILANGLSLTRTNMALRWPLDITTCQNDKLIYIAPPVLGKGIRKPPGERIRYIRRKHRAVDLSAINLQPESIASKTKQVIDELRKKAGLPAHKLTTKITKGGIEIMPKPGHAQVTGVREGRGFIYLNLNGGDSWGYYHPINSAEIIYNFKGEPAYKAEELIPEYYAQYLRKEARPDPHAPSNEEGDIYYLAFLDKRSDTYYRGTWDPATDKVELAPTNSVRKLNDFLLCHGQPKPDAIPEWDYRFAFDDPRVLDREARFINRYHATQYMAVQKTKKPVVPLTINKLLHHVMPSDEAVERFLNWLAVIYQKRIKPGTAWIWTGTQGVGKGLLFTRVLRPIFGEQHANEYVINQFEEEFNAFLEDSVLIMIDEAQREGLKSEEKVLKKLMHYITESNVSIRRMYSNPYTARNYTSFIIASNEPAPVFIAYNDRRFNVAPHQPNKIVITPKEIAQLDAELNDFAAYLATREADEDLARTPLVNKAREEMMQRGQKTTDRVADALLKGDLQFFIDAHAEPAAFLGNQKMHDIVNEYDKAIRDIATKALAHHEVKVWREQLRAIFEFLVGNVPIGMTKFGQYLGHHNIHYSRLYREDFGKSHQGLVIKFKFERKDVDEFLRDPVKRTIEQGKVTPITKGKKKNG